MIQQKHMKTKTLLGGIVVFLLAILALLFGLNNMRTNTDRVINNDLSNLQIFKKSATTSKVVNEDIQVHGNLYISYGKGSEPTPESHIYNLDKDSWTEKGFSKDETGYFHSTDGINTVFVGSTISELQKAINNDGKLGLAFQVYRTRNKLNKSLPLPSDSEKITISSIASKKNPTISENGMEIAYVTQAPIDPKKINTTFDDYKINIVESDSKKEVSVSKGTNPIWIDNDNLIFLNQDGVNKYNIYSKEITLFIPLKSQPNFKFTLSNSKKILALSIPDSKKVFIYNLTDSPNVINSFDSLAYWVVFSPDDKLIAVQSIKNLDNNSSVPVIDFYTTKDYSKIEKQISLSGIDNNKLFFSAWN